jgi:DNA processing protein
MNDAPPVLFYSGSLQLLERPAVGICGARNVSTEGLRAAAACGELAAMQGIVSVSGYARGVDTATHAASLKAGGATIIVLPEGINHFRVKKNVVGEVWDQSRALVVSQFAPTQTWSAGAAMTRNSIIIGLSMALVVVEAGEKGGTLAAGTKALSVRGRVLALEFSSMPIGNKMLVDKGAYSCSQPR